jgi:ATP-dependent RNA helicase DDX10/DBP4
MGIRQESFENEGCCIRYFRKTGQSSYLRQECQADKKVRFVYETFRRLHPGLPLLHLHGKQKQTTRLTTFDRFSSSKSSLLICTDVAARGLDFPAVDWVIQLDAPEDVDTYIHRVGRTARYQSEGKALLFLCPSEEKGMVQRWGEKSIEVKKIKIKSSKMGDLKQQMQNFAFREPEIKYLGQRVSPHPFFPI